MNTSLLAYADINVYYGNGENYFITSDNELWRLEAYEKKAKSYRGRLETSEKVKMCENQLQIQINKSLKLYKIYCNCNKSDFVIS